MAEATPSLERSHPLGGEVFATSGSAITLAPASFRTSLRAKSQSSAAVSKALGVDLPKRPKTSSVNGSRIALWLGPDEWLILDHKSNPIDDLQASKTVVSAVDVSHRNTAVLVSGAASADVLNGGCPQDLSLEAFPVGACSRTHFGKAEVVLHRTKTTVFRVEVWRSFSRYVFDLLKQTAEDQA